MRVLRFMLPAAAIGILLTWLIVPTLLQTATTDSGPQDVSVLPPLENAEIVRVLGKIKIPEGRPVSISGRITADPEYNVDGTHLQVFVESGAKEADLIVRLDGNIEVTQGDYVTIEGALGGRFVGETEDGGSIDMLEIIATSIGSAAAEGVLAPASTVWEPQAKKEEAGVTVSVNKVEFARAETRVYITARNAGEATAVIQVFNSFIKQSDRFFEPQAELPEGYPEVPVDLSAGAAGAGVIVFRQLDDDTPLEFSLTVLGGTGESVFDFELEPSSLPD